MDKVDEPNIRVRAFKAVMELLECFEAAAQSVAELHGVNLQRLKDTTLTSLVMEQVHGQPTNPDDEFSEFFMP